MLQLLKISQNLCDEVLVASVNELVVFF